MTLLRTILVAGALLSTTSMAQTGLKSWPVRQAHAELHPAISHADLTSGTRCRLALPGVNTCH